MAGNDVNLKRTSTFSEGRGEVGYSFTMSVSASSLTSPDVKAASYVISDAEMAHWLATTDAKLTFVGPPLNALSTQAAQSTTVTYCSSRVDNVCGGACTVYTGGPICLAAPSTVCLAATHNVGFCNKGGCGGKCNQYASCGTVLDSGFCYTPGTNSILVGNY